jgi:hypothetical protein
MKFIFLLLIVTSAFAKAPIHWSYVLDVSDQHEFYKSGELITHPKDAWQSLFALFYVDRNLNPLKDCVFYRVPGESSGILKIKTIQREEKCEDFLLKTGDRELRNLKSLQFIISDETVKLSFSGTDFKAQSWEALVHGKTHAKKPQQNLSSAEFKAPKLIYLAPVSSLLSLKKGVPLKENILCHDINEDCQEVSPPRCGLCVSGWYEIPNGCSQGPKYCGTLQCGEKNAPACRRGMKWQRKESEFDCRTDSSFAYCKKGLSIECEGRKAFCR